MPNLKYNPLLKLNLQEEADVNTNTIIHSASEFVSDCQKIQTDDVYPRVYQLTQNLNLGALTCNFSVLFLLNGYTLTCDWSTVFNGKILYFYNGNFHFLRNGRAEKVFFDNVNINNNEAFFIQAKLYYFFNCKLTNTDALKFYFNVNKGCNLIVYNQRENIVNNVNYNTFSVINYNSSIWTFTSDGTAKFGNTPYPRNYVNIDTALDPTSPGLVPNSVLAAKFAELAPDPTLDAESNKPVMNSAVTQSINNITQIIGNFQDINVSTLQEFEKAIQTGQTANVRIHLIADITLAEAVSYNLDKIQIYGHDHKINLENYTFTINGQTAYFYQVRFNANSAVGAYSANNYSDAQINIISTVSSARYFFEYVIFLNFVCKNTDNQATDYVRTLFDVKTTAGVNSASLHLYFMFCECMTNYEQSNINNLCLAVYHSGTATADNNDDPNSTKLHALTVHNIDYWGNAQEANSCPNWTFSGNTLNGKKKLGWITDGSAVYATRTPSKTPSFTNQYNPSSSDFLTLKNSFTFQTFNDLKFNSYTSSQVECYTTVYYNSYIAIVKFYTVGSGNIPPGAFSNKIPIKLIDSIQLDSNVQVNAEADGFTLVSVNQTAPGMYGTFTMPILQN